MINIITKQPQPPQQPQPPPGRKFAAKTTKITFCDRNLPVGQRQSLRFLDIVETLEHTTQKVCSTEHCRTILWAPTNLRHGDVAARCTPIRHLLHTACRLQVVKTVHTANGQCGPWPLAMAHTVHWQSRLQNESHVHLPR